jgi:hypothetical protein
MKVVENEETGHEAVAREVRRDLLTGRAGGSETVEDCCDPGAVKIQDQADQVTRTPLHFGVETMFEYLGQSFDLRDPRRHCFVCRHG